MAEDPMKYLRLDPAQLIKEQSVPFDAKKWVWVPTKDTAGYYAAEVKSVKGDKVVVETKKGEMEVKKEDCGQMNPPKYTKCADMSSLTYLNEASVLHNLKARYESQLIYTYSGLFCVAVNPYKRLPIYTDEVIKLYRGKRRPEMPPHIFSIVDNAYQDMLSEHENQSMLITGESGAGKTENTKKVIQYIAKVAGVEKKQKQAPAEGKMKGTLDEQIVETNPLLESFGNAKTIRNNNSSRFGKFIRCHFSNVGKLAGADIESYLLEKNRVIHQLPAERNYHIFYQLIYATTDEELSKYCLLSRKACDYGFLEKGVPTVDRIDDHEEYGLTCNAIKVLGFSDEEKDSMFKMCAAILNFSNMKFKQKPRDEQAEVCDPADGERVGYLLGIPVGEFHKSLVKPKVKVGTEFVNKGQNVNQVLYSVAALSKALYERMFLWIVTRINKALDTKERRSYFIGVLDIAGFEIFEYNSFEQLCINLTNEKLQQFFNHHMFVLEQEEYKKEGIHWEFIDFGMDLEETINLIEKPMGIFAMLEEECIVPKATDQTYLTKLHKEHENSKAYTKPSLKQVKTGGGDFILHHYAGSVGYSVAGWLEKNKDPITEHTAQLFSKATDPLVSSLFQDYNPDTAGARRKGSAFQTVSYRHKQQLNNLLSTLMSTSPHFVRCIIPNEQKQPGLIEGQLVLHQLRCNGVLEGIRICRKGFPSRMLFQDFRQRYQILASNAIPSGFVDGKVAAEKLISALQLDENEYRVGTTKVFFRAGIVGQLEDLRDDKISKIISQFQAYCKGSLMRKEYKKMCDQRIGIATIQRNVRRFLILRNWPWWQLYIKVQPLLSIARAEEEMKEKEEELKKAMENAKENEEKRKELESSLADTVAEKDKLFSELQAETNRLIETEDKLMNMQSVKDKLEASLNEALEKLDGEEHSVTVLEDKIQEREDTIDELTQKGEELAASIDRLETEKNNRNKQIDTLNADLAKQDEAMAKLGKEKKNVENTLAERTEQLQQTEDKVSNLNKVKSKLETSLKDVEHTLQREKESKAKVEKEKRKVEGDLKQTKQQLADTETALNDSKDVVQKKEKAIKALEEVRENNENQIKQLQKKIQELLARIEELEEELENERKLRHKGDIAKKDLEAQIDELQEQLESQGGATTAQVEVSKKREAECMKLRNQIEEINAANDAAASSAKHKHNAAIAEAQEEIETIKKAKAKSDKEKAALGNELQDLQAEIDTLKKKKSSGDKASRALEEQLEEMRNRLSETESRLADSESKNTKSSSENTNLAKQLEEIEHKLGLATKANKTYEAKLSEADSSSSVEAKVKHDMNLKLQDALRHIEQLEEQLDEEAAQRSDLQNKFSKANTEAQQWKSKYDVEGASKMGELEEAKRKLGERVQEAEDALAAALSKTSSMEKVKKRLTEEVEDLLLDLEKCQTQASNMAKKQKKVDEQINEWKYKCDEIQEQFNRSQAEARGYSAEVVKLRAENEEISDQNNALKRDNNSMSAQLQNITEQLDEDGKHFGESEKIRRKLEGDNEELQVALEEAETALEDAEAKFLKAQLEIQDLKLTSARQLSEKEEELENNRKNLLRQLESLQSSIDAEARSKADAQKMRKRVEGDLMDLEARLESSVKSSMDYQKTIKKLQAQIKELQGLMDDESRSSADLRDSVSRAERRANDLSVQLDEARVQLEQVDRIRKLSDNEKDELFERIAELQALYNNASIGKRKAEGDFHQLQDDVEQLEDLLKAAEDKAAKSQSESAKLIAELNSANENSVNAEKSRALLARQVADLQAQLDDAEMSSGKLLKNTIRRLEQRIMELENILDSEARRSAEVMKEAKKNEAKARDFEFKYEDERKSTERVQETVEKLHSKLKKMQLAMQESEQNAATWQSKYKKAAVELEEAEERCQEAEDALQKQRQRTRMQSQAPSRESSAAPSRSRSRLRTPVNDD